MIIFFNIFFLGDIVILFLIQNIFLFCLIFWLFTWIGEYFYKKKNHFFKKKFYECGFKSTSDINIQINFNFSIICVFLILYDVEFTLLMPFLINLSNVNIFSYMICLCFINLVIISLIYDWQLNALNWQI